MSALKHGEVMTIGKYWVRYQTTPIAIHGHRVNLVQHDVWVQPDICLKIPTQFFQCVVCKLHGTYTTMSQYNCS